MDFGSGLSCLRLALFGAVFCDAPDVLASISFSRLSKNLSGTVYGVRRVALSKSKLVLLISLGYVGIVLWILLFLCRMM